MSAKVHVHMHVSDLAKSRDLEDEDSVRARGGKAMGLPVKASSSCCAPGA